MKRKKKGRKKRRQKKTLSVSWMSIWKEWDLEGKRWGEKLGWEERGAGGERKEPITLRGRGRWVTPVASRPEGVWPRCSPGLVSYSLFASSLLSGILVVFRWARHTSTLGPLHWLFRLPNIVPLNWVGGSNVTSVRLILTPFPFLKCNSFLRNFLHPFPAFFFL